MVLQDKTRIPGRNAASSCADASSSGAPIGDDPAGLAARGGGPKSPRDGQAREDDLSYWRGQLAGVAAIRLPGNESGPRDSRRFCHV